MRAARTFAGVVARSLAQVEDHVSPPQLRVLVVVAMNPMTSTGAVAEALAIHPSGATRLCDRLVAAGYLQRTAAPQDRRTVLLELTAAGSALLDAVMEHRRSMLHSILETMAAADRRALQHVLTVFCDAAGEPPDDRLDAGLTRLARALPPAGHAAST